MHKSSKPQFDIALMQEDMAARGWLAVDLSRRAGVSHMTVGRFFSEERQTARTAKKIAVALGYSLSRYLVRCASNRKSASESSTVSSPEVA